MLFKRLRFAEVFFFFLHFYFYELVVLAGHSIPSNVLSMSSYYWNTGCITACIEDISRLYNESGTRVGF